MLISCFRFILQATHHIYQLERVEQLKRERGIAENGVPFRKHVVIEDLAGYLLFLFLFL